MGARLSCLPQPDEPTKVGPELRQPTADGSLGDTKQTRDLASTDALQIEQPCQLALALGELGERRHDVLDQFSPQSGFLVGLDFLTRIDLTRDGLSRVRIDGLLRSPSRGSRGCPTKSLLDVPPLTDGSALELLAPVDWYPEQSDVHHSGYTAERHASRLPEVECTPVVEGAGGFQDALGKVSIVFHVIHSQSDEARTRRIVHLPLAPSLCH